jgi:2-polyprenyl-6-hydroxyphenyl methylase/3-demethylubiquinone-9 3-methyltransferase
MKQNASNRAAATPLRSTSETPAGLQVVATEKDAPLERDRIAEAYLGRWGSETTQRRARDRIDWMAARARGPRILDIGCSEGILALLLARAGQHVLGIDVEPAAIAAASDLVGSEPSVVRDRIDLRVADALSVELGEEPFDTVILGEVIEHLADPAAMLERAAASLKPGGRLVLTTPFGYFPITTIGRSFGPRSWPNC